MNIEPGFVRTLLSRFWGECPTGKALCEAATGAYNQAYYAHEPSQIVYALRFLPAYYFEYCALVARLYPRVMHLPCVNFLSLGCGLCPDYFAIQHNLSNIPFIYRGYDAVNWTAFRLMPTTNTNFARTVVAVEDIPESNLHWADVYLFPKSLGDINGPALKLLAERIASTTKKQIFFLNSYVKNSVHPVGDLAPFLPVHEKLLHAGFACQDNVNQADSIRDTNCALRTINHNFDFPTEYELHCSADVDPRDKCCCEITRGPIFKNTSMSFAVLEYVKA